ncbi:MAG: hypothetical protein JXA68_12310 [Ignavibacteriales bacterium]|nr:hypothetical protein [Ignavibacteriales bacterium]
MKNNNNIINSEKNWVTDLLKQLPEEKAPSDFEFKLMTKIHNKNFEVKSEQSQKKFNWVWVPAAATISTIIILFTIVSDNSNDKQNALMDEPPAINNTLSDEKSPELNKDIEIYSETVVENDEMKETEEKSVASSNNYRVVIKPNDVVEKETVDLPYKNNKGIELDDFITNNGLEKGIDNNRNLRNVSDGEFNFDGFYLQSTTDPIELEKLKAKIDSVEKRMDKIEKDNQK